MPLDTTTLFTEYNNKKVISSNIDNYIHVEENWAEPSKLTIKSKSDTYQVGNKISFVAHSKKAVFSKNLVAVVKKGNYGVANIVIEVTEQCKYKKVGFSHKSILLVSSIECFFYT